MKIGKVVQTEILTLVMLDMLPAKQQNLLSTKIFQKLLYGDPLGAEKLQSVAEYPVLSKRSELQ